MMATSEWLSPAGAGAILGVGPDRVAQLAREGVLTSMRTPGGHIRVRRDDVEQLVSEPEDVPRPSDRKRPADEEPAEDAPPEPPPPPNPKWKDVPPWKRRVREAEADVQVLQFDDERERLLEARARRQADRKRAEVDEAAKATEADRLRELKTFALSCMPYGVPDDVRAGVARGIEQRVSSGRYPASLARGHVETLLRGEVERLLRPWRAREARHQRVRQETTERKRVIDLAMLHATLQMPRDWDYDTRRVFERELRGVLEEECEPGMAQDEADDIAQDVLDDWMKDDGQEDE